MPTTTAPPKAKLRERQRQRKCSRPASRSQGKLFNLSNSQAIALAFSPKGITSRGPFSNLQRPSAITQNLWASRTVTQVIGTDTAIVTQLYQTPLRWQAGYDNRNRLISFTRAGVETRYSYDANSNRLSSLDKTTNDTDLDGSFDLDDFSQSSFQTLNVEGSSNKLLGFSQTLTKVKGTKTQAITTSNVSYSLDANGNLTNDGLRTFDYDEANRLAKVIASKDGEAAAISYLHNAFGQRVFKSEPKADSYQPNEQELGTDFITWLKKNFQWLFAQAQTDASIGTSFTFGDEQMPEWAVLGEYDNGSAKGKGRTEYIWLPTEDQSAIPVGLYRNGKFFAVHTDHLGTPRLMTNEANAPVWQWPYSAFGNNKPTGVLKATPNPRAAITNSPVLLRGTGVSAANELNLRMPGQYADEEAGQFYNYYRNYQPSQGRYTQNDPVGLSGGWNRFGYTDADGLNFYDPFGLAKDDPNSKPIISPIIGGRAASNNAGNLVQPIPLLGGGRSTAGFGRGFSPGTYAGGSIPARSSSRDFTSSESCDINQIGQSTGCHTCGASDAGTKTGNFVLDHQPPSSLNEAGVPQRLYPQCIGCSRQQGLDIIRMRRGQSQ